MRVVKPGFFSNEELAECSALARLLFIGLWTICDREGRLEDRPKRIKAEALPYDECNIVELITELETAGFVRRYKVDGVNLLWIPTFVKHQRPHPKELPSLFPAWPGKNTASRGKTRPSRGNKLPVALEQDLLLTGSSVNGEQDLEQPQAAESVFDQFWQAYPRKLNKQAALKAWRAAVKRTGDAVPILEAAAAFAMSDKGMSGQFCPYPATWLNAGGYEDDPAVWRDDKPRRSRAPTDEELANWNPVDGGLG